MREIVAKGKNKSEIGLINLKSKVLNPVKATKVSDIDKVLTDWRHTRRQVREEDPSFPMGADTLCNILLSIIPDSLVTDMRKKSIDNAAIYKNDYDKFEAAFRMKSERRVRGSAR